MLHNIFIFMLITGWFFVIFMWINFLFDNKFKFINFYRIFRLFKCPHKYIFVKEIDLCDRGRIFGLKRIKQCARCGKEKSFSY